MTHVSDGATTAEHAQALSASGLFQGLSPSALERVAAIVQQERLEQGALIFRQGDAGNALYLITSGQVRISRTLPGVGEEALAILGPGDAFGEMALVDEGERSADAYAHEACVVLSIGREVFEDLLFIHRELAYEILWNFVKILSGRLRETNDKVTLMSLSSKF